MGVYYIGSIPCSGGDIYHYGRKGMKWGKNIFGKISEFFTGNNTRRELSSARTALRGAQQKSRHFGGKDINGNYAFDIRKDYNNPINSSGRTYYPFEETGKRWSPEINRQNDRLNKAQADYDRTLPGMMAKAREKVSKAYSDAASALSGKGLDIQSFYSQVMQKAQGAINQGKNMVSKYGGQFVSQIQNLGSKALEGGKAFLDNAMERAKNAGRQIGEATSRVIKKDRATRNKRDVLDPSPRIIEETKITENIIPETKIRENNISSRKSNKASESISRLKVRKAEKRDAEYDAGHKDNRDYRNKNNNLNQKIRRNTNYAQRLVEKEYKKRGYGPNNPAPDNFMRDVLRRDEEERLARQRKK